MCRKNYKNVAYCMTVAVIAAFSMVLALMGYKCDAAEETAGVGQAVTEIRTVDELLAAAKSGTGNYILKTDIDMSGIDWKPWDFSGSFDGDGHSILNLTVTACSDKTSVTYDGNRKTYDTRGAGFFGTIENATISNLNLVGAKIDVISDTFAFAAPIAGCSIGSTVKNCDISAYVSLTDSALMWGVGGIVGYGNGDIENVKTDVTLICIDTDVEVKDEQFMGGAYAAGFMNIRDCSIIIDGYDSDHGYVHNGGLVGMYIVYPLSEVSSFSGEIINNSVEGKITFFEDNRDRRAYCVASVGEVMNWTYRYGGFSSDFKVDERKDYSKNLLPEMCENASYTDTVTPASPDAFGYTTHKCNTCGYSYKDAYTIHEHKMTGAVAVIPATTQENGLDKGICSLCNQEVYMVTEKIVEEPATESANTEHKTSDGKQERNKAKKDMAKIIAVISVIVVIIGIIFIIARIVSVRKARKKRRTSRRH